MGKIRCETLVIDVQNVQEAKFWVFLLKILSLVLLVIAIHYFRATLVYKEENNTNLEIPLPQPLMSKCDQKIAQLHHEMAQIKLKLLEATFAIEKSQLSDEIGLFDYAAEYAGGRIVSTLNTKPYPTNRKIRLLGTFDLSFDSKPESLIRPSNYPGECYAFSGSQGQIVIELGTSVIVSAISLQHVRFNGADGLLTSAPNTFKVWSFSILNDWVLLGSYYYNLNDGIIQTFPTIRHNDTSKILKLEILSNYGNPEFTCVYRFRAHSLKNK